MNKPIIVADYDPRWAVEFDEEKARLTSTQRAILNILADSSEEKARLGLAQLAVLNIPHPARMHRALRTFRQLRKSWYVFFFQLPLLPERFMTDERLQRLFHRIYQAEEISIVLQAVRDRSPTGPLRHRRVQGHRISRRAP